jgi:hypothetical protein
MAKMRMLRQSDMATECDACGERFDLMTGGVCERCERILCARHLHGSWLRRMRHEVGGAAICVRCRAGERGAGSAPPNGALPER